jgi:hypothetical protein
MLSIPSANIANVRNKCARWLIVSKETAAAIAQKLLESPTKITPHMQIEGSEPQVRH